MTFQPEKLPQKIEPYPSFTPSRETNTTGNRISFTVAQNYVAPR